MRTTTEYSPDGKLLETRSDHGNGFTLMFTHEYDSYGRLIKIKPANSDYPNSEIVYVYDDAGRNLSITNTANAARRFLDRIPKQTLATNGTVTTAGRSGTTYVFDHQSFHRGFARCISPILTAKTGSV